MKTRLFSAGIATAMLCSGCVSSIDRTEPMENEDLWRAVHGQPLRFIPRGWPSHRTGPASGKWLTDPQDQTMFFIPGAEYATHKPGFWEAEARKHLNRYSKDKQGRRNLTTLLVRGPLRTAGATLLILGTAGYGFERATEIIEPLDP